MVPPIVANLSTVMEQIPVRHLRLVPVAPGVYRQTQADAGESSDENITKALVLLVEAFGLMAVQNLFDYIDLSGTDPLRARLARIGELKGGR